MRKTYLPKTKVVLTFVTNKYNGNLASAVIDGRHIADITFYPSQGLMLNGDGGARGNFHLYTSMPNVIDEGFYFSRASAEARANWRANIG